MEVGAYEAETNLPKLLALVAKGERVVITKHGKPIADIVPHAEASMVGHAAAVQRLLEQREALRKTGVRVTRKEAREWVNEGRP